MNIKSVAAVIFCISHIFLISCRQQTPHWGGRIEEQDGITIVKNPASPMYSGEIFALQEELSIGDDNEKTEYLFSRINDIEVDEEGLIYVIDDADSNIRVFDKDGGFLRTIGRKGQGPGEFQKPIGLQVTADDKLYVVDYSGRAVYFSLEGDFLHQELLPRPILPIKRDSQGNLVGIEIAAPPPLGGKVIKKYDSHLKPLMVIATEEMGTRGIFDIGKPSCYCAVTESDQVIWGDSKEYVLYVLDPQGQLIKIITKEHKPQKISAADREGYEKRYAEPLKAGMKINFRSHYPAFSDIYADDTGRILVKTYERVDHDERFFYFDVFNPDGIYIAKAPLKASLDRTSVWKHNKLYALMDSPEGYPMVKRYRVTWKD
ncbi:MAG: hypothetical protein A2Y70_06320 [Candidatus Aminicenantes bacterium RBG_13_64_14]|nr:MAG: hypothetical protein A2Y70_06320 [Candidatus Aminicenantes bacterium RBG_13_64_14]